MTQEEISESEAHCEGVVLGLTFIAIALQLAGARRHMAMQLLSVRFASIRPHQIDIKSNLNELLAAPSL